MIEQSTKAPWHLWAIGIVATLWNGYGAYDYFMTKTENRAYIEAMVPGDVTANLEYFNSMPLYANVFWALGVWGGLAAAILLLMRSKFAAPAFLISLIGAAGGLATDLFNLGPAKPEAIQGSGYTIMMAVIVVIAVLLWQYARRQAKAGVLK